MSTRIDGFRHVILHARAAKRLLEAGKIGPALYEWGASRAHVGFMVGLIERGAAPTFASRLLTQVLIHLGQQLENAVTPRPEIPGYDLMEPIKAAFIGLPANDEHLTNRAAVAAADLKRRWDIRERR